MAAAARRPASFILAGLLFAALAGAAAILVDGAHWGRAEDAWPAPPWLLMTTAWWRAARREDMPLALVLALGFLNDAVVSGVIGPTLLPLTAVAMAPTHLISQRGGAGRAGRWLAFAVLAAAYSAGVWAVWAVWGLLHHPQPYSAANLAGLGDALKMWISAVVVYPFVAGALRRTLGTLQKRGRG